METAFPLNLTIFAFVNAPENANRWIVLTAKGLAVYSPWVLIVLLIGYWFLGTPDLRRALMVAGVALGIGLCVNFALALSLYAPRPFIAGIGRTLLEHGPETSFPSDHATFLWSIGFGVLWSRRLWIFGAAVVGFGFVVAWARVYLGVHFPLDMAASLVIGAGAAVVAGALSGALERRLFQPVERLHCRILDTALRQRKS